MAEGHKSRVISKRKIREFLDSHPGQARHAEAIWAWYRTALRAPWSSFAAVRASFAGADAVGRYVVFNVAGNHLRVVALIFYGTKPRRIYIRHISTHREYDKGAWKD